MALITTARWDARGWTNQQFTRGSRHSLWGVPVRVQVHENHVVQGEGDIDNDDADLVGPGGVGRHFNLAGGSRLVWRHVTFADRLHPLAPFETTPGELDHLCEGGARVSMLWLPSVPTDPTWRHRLTLPPGTDIMKCEDQVTQAEIDFNCHVPEAARGSYRLRAGDDGRKCGHIVRPRAIGHNGNKVWGRIDIANGVSRVQFRRADLLTLATPVRIFGMDTIGETVNGASTTNVANDFVIAHGGVAAFTAGASGTLDDVKFFSRSETTTDNKVFAVWNDNTATPEGGSRVDLSAETAMNTTLEEKTFALTGGAVVSGNPYWIGWNAEDDATRMNYDDPGGDTGDHYHFNSLTWTGVPDDDVPDPYPGGATDLDWEGTIHVTFTPSVVGAAKHNIIGGGFGL